MSLRTWDGPNVLCRSVGALNRVHTTRDTFFVSLSSDVSVAHPSVPGTIGPLTLPSSTSLLQTPYSSSVGLSPVSFVSYFWVVLFVFRRDTYRLLLSPSLRFHSTSVSVSGLVPPTNPDTVPQTENNTQSPTDISTRPLLPRFQTFENGTSTFKSGLIVVPPYQDMCSWTV